MDLQKQKAFIIRFLYIALILGLSYYGAKYVVPLLMPFITAMVIASILRPLIDGLEEKTHLRRSFIAIMTLIVFYSLLVIVVNIFGIKIFSFISDLVSKLPEIYQKAIEPALDKIGKDFLRRFPEIENYTEDIFVSIKSSISGVLTKLSSSVLGFITGFAGQVPSMLIKLVFTIVASFFFTIDYHRIGDFILKQFSKEQQEMLLKIKESGIGTLGKFIRAYATLIMITFIELAIGLWILKVPNAFLLGAVIAFVDILPILGTGAVLLPWILIAFVFGKTSFAIGMLVLYLVITIVRQTLEPRVVGQQIGLHPVVTLICMFVGAQLLGVLGLLLLPITATIIKKMNDEGTIHFFR